MRFQPTCPVRGTTEMSSTRKALLSFQPTCPVRGTTPGCPGSSSTHIDFNPRAPYGARLAGDLGVVGVREISTHVPRTGHDPFHQISRLVHRNFNPRAPYGARLVGCSADFTGLSFQPTCPVRGTTRWRSGSAPRRATFQPTCPVRGTTFAKISLPSCERQFQPTCPVRGTTRWAAASPARRCISTHVPRTGHDMQSKS